MCEINKINYDSISIGSLDSMNFSDSCPICLTKMKANTKTLTCQHIFHKECIESWELQNNTCPICRSQIDPDFKKVKIITIPIILPPLPNTVDYSSQRSYVISIPNNLMDFNSDNTRTQHIVNISRVSYLSHISSLSNNRFCNWFRTNKKIIKRKLFLGFFVLSILSIIGCSAYFDAMIHISNNYINDAIKGMDLYNNTNSTNLDFVNFDNNTEPWLNISNTTSANTNTHSNVSILGNKDDHTYSAYVLSVGDFLYWFYYISMILTIYKTKNTSYPCVYVFYGVAIITIWIIRGAFYSNTLSYLSDTALNLDKYYLNQMSCAFMYYGCTFAFNFVLTLLFLMFIIN